MKYIILIIILGFISCKENPKTILIEGTYTSQENLFYKSFTFKGKSTVILKDAIIGFEHVLSYEKDENFIRIKATPSDLLLKIITSDSLIGEGFAFGAFKKVKE